MSTQIEATSWTGRLARQSSPADVARKLRRDVLATVVNMAFTLFMAFVAFQLFALPLLEHKALLH